MTATKHARSRRQPFRVVSVGDEATAKRPVLDPAAPLLIARAFLTDTGLRLLYHGGELLEWTGSYYRPLADSEARSRIYAYLDRAQRLDNEGDLVDFQPNRRKVSDVEDALRAEAALPGSIRAPAWLDREGARRDLDPFDLIAFPNGLLHVLSRKLLPPTPAFFNRSALPFSFKRKAPPPRHFLAFVDSLFPDDPEAREALQELTGLLLVPITRFQKIFLIVGPPRSGKGVFARVVRQLVGPANCAALMLHSLGDRFGAQSLIGKSVAFVSDARLSARVDGVPIAERLLAISGEDSPAVQRKNLPDWDGALATRFVLLSNELPRLSDASGALAARLLVLKLETSHLGCEDLDLESRFVPELPGILLWALEGLNRLLARGRFIQPASGKDLIEQVADLGSPVSAFLRERCKLGKHYSVSRKDLFDGWSQWCESTGEKAGTSATFGRDLRAALPSVRDCYVSRTQRGYRGLRLLDRPRVASMRPEDMKKRT